MISGGFGWYIMVFRGVVHNGPSTICVFRGSCMTGAPGIGLALQVCMAMGPIARVACQSECNALTDPNHGCLAALMEVPDCRVLAPLPSDVGAQAEALASQEAAVASRKNASSTHVRTRPRPRWHLCLRSLGSHGAQYLYAKWWNKTD